MAVVSLVTRSVLQRRKQLLTILLALFLVCNLAVFQRDALLRSAATLGWSGSVANTASIPRTIHQTWKTSNLRRFAAQHPDRFDWFSSWDRLNPAYRHLLRDDAQIETYVKAHFPGRVYAAFARLPQIVQRADLYRYLVLLRDGGVYTDLDTICRKPVDRWAPDGSKGIKFIAGLEWDWDGDSNEIQMCQWTMAAAPRHPIMVALVEWIVREIEEKSDDELRSVDMVVPLTGPHPWTNAIRDYIASIGDDLQRAQNYTHGSVQMGDVLVLGMTSFSPGHSRSKGFDHPDACVEHIFTGDKEGGWKMVEKEARSREASKETAGKEAGEESGKDEEK